MLVCIAQLKFALEEFGKQVVLFYAFYMLLHLWMSMNMHIYASMQACLLLQTLVMFVNAGISAGF